MKLVKKYFSVIVLAFIVLLSFFLRIYNISEIPPSLNWDEVSHGYNAFSILNTGKDEWGFSFPLIFRAYGDYKLPLYIYLTTIPIFIFGLNELAVRLISVLAGVGLVLLAYLITHKITKNGTISLFAGFLMAVSPWSLFVSRAALEANLGAFLFALGGYFFLSYLDSKVGKNLVFFSVFLGLSIHAYNSCRIIAPLFVVVASFIMIRKKDYKNFLLSGLIFTVFLIPIIFQAINASGFARFNRVSLIDQGVINKINEKRAISGLFPTVSRIIFNKATFWIFIAGKNYLSNFSPRYLFLRGGNHYQFSLPDHELLYMVTAPFVLLGIIKMILSEGESGKILLFWLLIGFIPSAITKDAPHVLRSLQILPIPMVFSSIGLDMVVEFLKKNKSKMGGKFLLAVLFLSVMISFYKWWTDYSMIYPKAYSWAWQYGYKETALFIKKNSKNYDRIFFTKRNGESHEFLLFYLKYDPRTYQNDQNKKWDYHANWYWIDKFDKYEFVNDWEVVVSVKCEVPASTQRGERSEKCLLITSPGNYPEAVPASRQGWNIIKTINFLDGKPAFEILESN